jgi:predicted kinase
VIILLNGAFGIGKTTAARLLAARLPHATLFDPEWIGIPLQRLSRVDDFQDLRSWRRLTVAGLRVARSIWPNIVVPMAISNAAYLDEIRAGIGRFESRVHHFCLVAPEAVVHERLRSRGEDVAASAWQYRRATECCRIHEGGEFAEQIDAADRSTEEIAGDILKRVNP